MSTKNPETRTRTPEPVKKTKSNRHVLPPGPGRPKGLKNKVARELAEAAQEYTTEALEILIKVARSGKSEAARVAAACAILDRGHGKPRQQISADVSGQLTLEQIVLRSYKLDQPSIEHEFDQITGTGGLYTGGSFGESPTPARSLNRPVRAPDSLI